MRLSGFALVYRTIAILLLVTAIVAITTATLMPVIYRSVWFKHTFPKLAP